MLLSSTQRRYLRSLAHDLKPVVLLGAKGASAAVLKELALALDQHELVKVRLSGADKTERREQIAVLVKGSSAQNVQEIGHIVVLFRRNTQDPKLALPR